MEQVEEPPATDEVHSLDHHQNNNNTHYAAGLAQTLIHAGTKPLTTTTTASCNYFPPPELEYPMIYSSFPHRFIFNSNTQNHHNDPQQQRPYAEVVGAGGGGVLESCSGGSEAFNYGIINNNNCNSRWPREETMSLLQIRSRLHSSFKQATHKGPLWDEVSRIMYEEHGYQRSGKKCREKFENLYKYYKKTKEAKSGKHDGKHYRFFRQLEALYGDKSEVVGAMTDHFAAQPTAISSQTQFQQNSVNEQAMMMMRSSSSHLLGYADQEVSPNHHQDKMKLPCDQSCLSLTSNHSSSHFRSSSSEDTNKRSHDKNNKLKMKVKEFIDIQMKSLMEQQQLCMEKVIETVEQNEKERVLREEKWRKQAEERLEKQHKYWVSEVAWMRARDAALMETLQQFTAANSSSSRDGASLASHFQKIPFSTHPGDPTNNKLAESSVSRDPLALYNNQESQDRWFMGSNHHNHHEINGFRAMVSDGNNGVNGGSLIWDGSSFGLKLNNADDNHQD